jgi:hypothetical protein
MPYTGNKPSAVPLTSADITDNIIVNADINSAAAIAYSKLSLGTSIVNADIANSTINLTTKVTGTLPVANGGTGLTALGSANQVLAVNSGGTALAYTAVSSDYVLLATTTVSSAVASVTLDNYFTSTYTTYKILITNCMAATNNRAIYMQFRRSGADVTSGYFNVASASQIDNAGAANSYADYDANVSYIPAISIVQSSRGSLTLSSEITLWNPLETSKYQTACVVANGTYDGGATYPYFYTYNRQAYVNSTGALSGIKFYVSGSATNITSGTFKLYGIK